MTSQSTIKMEKGYYRNDIESQAATIKVAIHNKNGKGLLQSGKHRAKSPMPQSQSTIKMEKGYYPVSTTVAAALPLRSQSTIKMEKGYYQV